MCALSGFPSCRCRAIIHVVSGASPDPVGDFRAINQELALFSEALAEKPQVLDPSLLMISTLKTDFALRGLRLK